MTNSEYGSECFQGPKTNTTTWTRPSGLQVDPGNVDSSRNPSAAATEVSSSLVSEKMVEVKDFTRSEGNFGSETLSSFIERSRSPGTIAFELTYDDGKATSKTRCGLWPLSVTRARSSVTTDTSPHASDDLHTGTLTGLGCFSSNLCCGFWRCSPLDGWPGSFIAALLTVLSRLVQIKPSSAVVADDRQGMTQGGRHREDDRQGTT